MQKQKNYKNAGTQILIPDNSVEPLNIMSSGNTGLSSSSNFEGCETILEKVAINRVPVQSKSGKPLMPCKPTKARKLLRDRKAVKKWSKLGIFYIQLNFDHKSEPNKNQTVVLGLDPGSKFDGYSVTSKTINLTGMSELPSGIVDALKTRRTIRRARRYRNCPRREKRFDNRNKDGFIAPSQKAKVDFRLKIVTELLKLYPVTDFVVEDVRFNHYKKQWGKHFSTVEIGKTFVYEELRKLGNLILKDGFETSIRRKELGLRKGSKKEKREPESHATDAIALASFAKELDSIAASQFFVWKRYQNSRRQLHRFEPNKKGIRTRYGGSDSLSGFKKNDVVIHQGKLARIGGYMGNRMSLHEFDLDNKRFMQSGNPVDCIKLFNQKVMFEEIAIRRGTLPPHTISTRYPLSPVPRRTQ